MSSLERRSNNLARGNISKTREKGSISIKPIAGRRKRENIFAGVALG
jgi:hypothetical protein